MHLYNFNRRIHLELIFIKRLNTIAREGVIVSCTIRIRQETKWMLAKIHCDNKSAIPKMEYPASEIC